MGAEPPAAAVANEGTAVAAQMRGPAQRSAEWPMRRTTAAAADIYESMAFFLSKTHFHRMFPSVTAPSDVSAIFSASSLQSGA